MTRFQVDTMARHHGLFLLELSYGLRVVLYCKTMAHGTTGPQGHWQGIETSTTQHQYYTCSSSLHKHHHTAKSPHEGQLY